MPSKKLQHPIQPLYKDREGNLRFKENTIVKFLKDHARSTGMGLNRMEDMPFPREDWEQFMQLIGYTLDGIEELNLLSKKTYNRILGEMKK